MLKAGDPLPGEVFSKGMPIILEQNTSVSDFERCFEGKISVLDTLTALEICVLFFECLGMIHILPQSHQIKMHHERILLAVFKDDLKDPNNEQTFLLFLQRVRDSLGMLFKGEIKDFTQPFIIGLFVFTIEYPKALDDMFPFYIKILEYFEPEIKGFGASAICWLLQTMEEKHGIATVGERWIWIINESLSGSLLHYYDALVVLRPASLLFLKINKENPSLIVERFLNTLYLGSSRYKDTESWMIHIISEQVKNPNIAAKLFLLHWPSWGHFLSRITSNTPVLEDANHDVALEILKIMLQDLTISEFLKRNPKEVTKIISWLMIWNSNVKRVKQSASFLLHQLMDISAIDQALFFEELKDIHPSLCQHFLELL